MPKVIKKRPPKKKPIQEEEVKSVAQQAIEKLRQRQRQAMRIGIAVGVIVLVLLVSSLYSTSQYKEAMRLQREGLDYYYGRNAGADLSDKERMKKAVELLTQSVEKKPTPTGLYYLGNAYYRQGNYDRAIEYYLRFEDRFKGEELMLALVYQKLASAYFKKGMPEAGLKTLEKLKRLRNGIFTDTALMMEARYNEEAGNNERAIEIYRKLVQEYPDSPWSVEARAKLPEDSSKRR